MGSGSAAGRFCQRSHGAHADMSATDNNSRTVTHRMLLTRAFNAPRPHRLVHSNDRNGTAPHTPSMDTFTVLRTPAQRWASPAADDNVLSLLLPPHKSSRQNGRRQLSVEGTCCRRRHLRVGDAGHYARPCLPTYGRPCAQAQSPDCRSPQVCICLDQLSLLCL